MTPAALVQRWRDLAGVMLDCEAFAQGAVLMRCAQELADVLAQDAAKPLSLTEAARASGYSADHLARLLREGKLPNVAPAGARPRVRRGDLPKKHRGGVEPAALQVVP